MRKTFSSPVAIRVLILKYFGYTNSHIDFRAQLCGYPYWNSLSSLREDQPLSEIVCPSLKRHLPSSVMPFSSSLFESLSIDSDVWENAFGVCRRRVPVGNAFLGVFLVKEEEAFIAKTLE